MEHKLILAKETYTGGTACDIETISHPCYITFFCGRICNGGLQYDHFTVTGYKPEPSYSDSSDSFLDVSKIPPMLQ